MVLHKQTNYVGPVAGPVGTIKPVPTYTYLLERMFVVVTICYSSTLHSFSTDYGFSRSIDVTRQHEDAGAMFKHSCVCRAAYDGLRMTFLYSRYFHVKL